MKGRKEKMEVPEASSVLIFGGTGYIGKHMVKASVKLGHKTYVYARPITQQTAPDKLNLHKEFESTGVTIVQGELDEFEKMVEVLGQVDVVICSLAYPQVLCQLKIIDAIKIAGNIKRFLPSDFGVEEDRVVPLPPFEAFLEKKRKIRRFVEESGIPYTFVSANCFGSYFVNYLLHPHEQQDEIIVYGTGEAKAVFNYEEDIAMYTIKVANDPRACNRVVIYRPPRNAISQLELISLWEDKTGRSFKRVHMEEEELVKLTESLPTPKNIPPAILHCLFVKGDTMSFEIDEDEIEGSSLYPDYKYTAIDELLELFIVDPPKPASASFE